MMINKRLIGTVKESKRYIAANVVCQWFALIANITMMVFITRLFGGLYEGTAGTREIRITMAVAIPVLAVRFVCAILQSRMSFMSSKAVKRVLRERIYEKLLKMGASYNASVKTSEVVQVAVEGVDQLETYFGAYLPQFFYALLAPLTLFAVMCFINVPCAIVLLICVPLIPVAIVLVQRLAKKLLAKYWGEYTALGDTFLENLQGLTTLKIYQADDYKQQEMNVEAERFRKITMRVLTMQLNSITIMDLIAYGGAALGVILSVTQYMAGNVTLSGCLLIILLSADFFIPMRVLGSFFHIAMNGMAASDKIFRLLDLPCESSKQKTIGADCTIICEGLKFSYDGEREIIKQADMVFPMGSLTAVVGESGSGKSTISGILMGRNTGYTGSVRVGGIELSDISEESIFKNFTYIGHQSYIFKGTVRDNLLMGCPSATEEEMWSVLERVNMAGFLKSEAGLDTRLNEKAANLSGGQRQRLAIARALLNDSPVYIFDEATSNIDVESENDIMRLIHELSGEKTVILISHRLANVTGSDNIYVIENGSIAESGRHDELMVNNSVYAKLVNAQNELENYGKRGEQA